MTTSAKSPMDRSMLAAIAFVDASTRGDAVACAATNAALLDEDLKGLAMSLAVLVTRAAGDDLQGFLERVADEEINGPRVPR